jgi:putative methylase
MQKRLARKLDLEILLSKVEPHPSPTPDLEQYTIPADTAATILYIAAYSNNDIIGKTVLDLGCGTGRLAIGAAFLGAEEAVGIDIDKIAVRKALTNSINVGLENRLQWIAADIDCVNGKFDTVIQNPPFGVQKRGADRKFLQKSINMGRTVYSLHKSSQTGKAFVKRLKANSGGIIAVSPSPFLAELIGKNGGRIKAVYALKMSVPHMFDFHTKTKHEFPVDLYIIEGKEG